MFQKFIINRDGVLKFGHVYLHRDMLAPGEQCTYGGGLWKIDEGRGAIVLYGRSFDFGPPDFDRSEERRVGKECSERCRSRWSPYH